MFHKLHVLGNLWERVRGLGSETWKGCEWVELLVFLTRLDKKKLSFSFCTPLSQLTPFFNFLLQALEYSKGVKNVSLSRKPSKSIARQRPSSERGHEQSALEIMKERHEAERLAVEKMRQSLASIIREVKS